MNVITKRETAGELAQKALSDQTKYDALEVGYAMTDDLGKHLYESVARHLSIIDEPEFCVVMVLGKDPLLKTLIRRKFYCWPYLPKPRPNQSVFLYNRAQGRITKLLWCLPCDMVMAELATKGGPVDKRYERMQAWSIAFFEGSFWEYIRHEHGINMLSEHEYFLKHREELIQAGCQVPQSSFIEPFDFSKITTNQIVNSDVAV